MLFKKTVSLIYFLFFFHVISYSQESGLNYINKEDLKRHLSFIASDSLQGRTFGTPVPGLDIAANYIKSNAKSMGLKPGIDDYFQNVQIVSSQPDTENSFLEITDNNGTSIFKTNSVVGLPAGNEINISGAEVVFAGFGYSDEKTGYDDFAGIDVQEKIVLFSLGTPDGFKKKELPRWNNRIETEKVNRAMEAGAAGVILFDSPLDKGNEIYNRIDRWRNRGDYHLEIPDKKSDNDRFIFTTFSQVEPFFGNTAELQNLLLKISKKKQAHSFKIEGMNATLKIKMNETRFQAKNVIGIVEGSDPELKNEYVVFMAHYDHIGIDKNGDVFNGADDNGSGTVTLLEVAEAFMSLPEKPKRSIVFLWVTAEEVGELGSQYYTENPIFPLGKTVACINIDMDGRVFEQRDTVWNESPKKVKDFDGLYTLTNDVWPELKEINSSACKKLGLIPDYSLPSNFLRSSDHYSFHIKGVPVLNYATGYHADYHKVTDEISRINFDKMKRVADLCFIVGFEIANLGKIELPENKTTN